MPSLSIGDISVDEDESVAVVTVSVTPTSSNEITVAYTTIDDTAQAGSDYAAAAGTLVLPTHGSVGHVHDLDRRRRSGRA